MPLPSSGEIGFDDLNTEIGNNFNAELDLETAAIEFSIPTRPHGMDEFYGLSLSSLSVSPSSFTFNLAGGFKDFTTTTRSGDTVVTDNRDWLSISNRTNSGFRVIASTQTVGSFSRSGTVTVSNSNTSINIPISQNEYKATISISDKNISTSAAGVGENVNITSNASWAFSSVASWINLEASSGTGNYSNLLIYADQNGVGSSARNDYITLSTIATGGNNTSITDIYVSQPAGPAPTLSISPTSHTFVNTGSSRTFTVTSNTNWIVTGYPLWITIDDTTGGGSDTSFVATAEAQPLRSDARSALLVVSTNTGGTNISENVSISQPGRPEWSRTPASKIWEWDDDLSLSVNLSTNLPWSATLNSSDFEMRLTTAQAWSQGPLTGTGDDIIYVRASEVPSTGKQDREGTLTISETSTEYSLSNLTVSLTQEKPPFMGDLFYPYNSTTDRPGWGPGELAGEYENLNFWGSSETTPAYLTFQFIANRGITYEIREFHPNVQIVQPTSDLALPNNEFITRTTRGTTPQFRAKVLAPSAGSSYTFTLEFLTADEPNANFSIDITLGRTASQSNPPNVVPTIDTQPPTVRQPQEL